MSDLIDEENIVTDVSDEDKALFRKTVGTVQRIKSKSKAPIHKIAPAAKVSKHMIIDPPATQTLNLSNHYCQEVAAETILSFIQPGLGKKTLIQLRQGSIRYEAILDLHGFTPEAAKDTLCNFLLTEYNNHHRCILLIHGKGSRKGGIPVLKNLVNYWLIQVPYVLAFHSALPRDGGAGALYVLLKRNRLS